MQVPTDIAAVHTFPRRTTCSLSFTTSLFSNFFILLFFFLPFFCYIPKPVKIYKARVHYKQLTKTILELKFKNHYI